MSKEKYLFSRTDPVTSVQDLLILSVWTVLSLRGPGERIPVCCLCSNYLGSSFQDFQSAAASWAPEICAWKKDYLTHFFLKLASRMYVTQSNSGAQSKNFWGKWVNKAWEPAFS